jgi:hypothetical protein
MSATLWIKAAHCRHCGDGFKQRWENFRTLPREPELVCTNCGSVGKWSKGIGRKKRKFIPWTNAEWEWTTETMIHSLAGSNNHFEGDR